jgi:hypothetical protein
LVSVQAIETREAFGLTVRSLEDLRERGVSVGVDLRAPRYPSRS